MQKLVILLWIYVNHSELNHNVLSELPFFTLGPQEFLKTTGGWVHQSLQSVIESKDLFADIITSPERESELEESPYNNCIQSGYFTVKQSGKFFYEAKKNTMDFL